MNGTSSVKRFSFEIVRRTSADPCLRMRYNYSPILWHVTCCIAKLFHPRNDLLCVEQDVESTHSLTH